jgi:hypothetical protein
VTVLPLRNARKSLGGFCNSSEGGSGGPMDAQPTNISGTYSATNSLETESVMRKEKD